MFNNRAAIGWEMYQQTGEKPLQSLTALLFDSSPDDLTRCMATATMVTTLWQVAGRTMPFKAPSCLLVNASGLGQDILDKLARDKGGAAPFEFKTDSERTMEKSHRAVMASGIKAAKERSHLPHDSEILLKRDRSNYTASRDAAFGSGRAGYYAQRMTGPQLGCVTGSSNDTILRLDRPEDYGRFRDDIHSNPGSVRKPEGYDDDGVKVKKLAYVAGSLSPAQWDPTLVADIIEHGLPVLFLPHAAKEQLRLPDNMDWLMISNLLAEAAPASRMPSIPDYPEGMFFSACEDRLRSRLRHYPAAYEFFILQTIREIGQVCLRIAHFVAHGQFTDQERNDLYLDMHRTCVRAITLGIEGLAYHGYGFDAGCPRAQAVKLLSFIRAKGEVSRRDVLKRFQSLSPEQRDGLLDKLSAQGLVTLTERAVSAVTLTDFVQALPVRARLPEPGWASVLQPNMRVKAAAAKKST